MINRGSLLVIENKKNICGGKMRAKIYLPYKLYIETFEAKMDYYGNFSRELTIYSGLVDFLQKYAHPVPNLFLIKVKDDGVKYVPYLILSKDSFVKEVIVLKDVYINLGDLHD